MCTYGGRNKKIGLVTEKSINYNKSLIFSELLQKKDIEYSELEPFNVEKMKLKFEIRGKMLEFDSFSKL